MTAEPGRRIYLMIEKKDDGEPAAKGRLDQRLGVRLLDLGEYVEVLVETPASQTRATVSSVQRKL